MLKLKKEGCEVVVKGECKELVNYAKKLGFEVSVDVCVQCEQPVSEPVEPVEAEEEKPKSKKAKK